METVYLKIAGITIGIQSEVLGVIKRFVEMYRHYLRTDGDACYATLTISVDDMKKYIRKEKLPFDENSSTIYSRYIYSSAYDPISKRAHLLTDLDNIYPVSEEYLMKWFSHLCIENGKLLFHSSVVINQNDEARIFYGPSGIGKSTIVQLSENHHVFTDDLSVLERRPDSDFCIYKTPFERNKNAVKARKIAIKGMYRLHQSTSDSLQKLPAPMHTANLLANVWNLDFNNKGYELYHRVIERDFGNTPGYNLFFMKHSNFWNLIS
ncbi:hypothetical protein QQ008_07080 [Fulvivirgaceae bacterium BMA10]|uniref:Uncharacterized protein n=1 Tax=Splendidivirga corallicola TaxID=3051826 RepID=A0ABT8KK75_9BACT|nr:hypothetical protein [Fulvivirgaceae bacterium BMA10]